MNFLSALPATDHTRIATIPALVDARPLRGRAFRFHRPGLFVVNIDHAPALGCHYLIEPDDFASSTISYLTDSLADRHFSCRRRTMPRTSEVRLAGLTVDGDARLSANRNSAAWPLNEGFAALSIAAA